MGMMNQVYCKVTTIETPNVTRNDLLADAHKDL